MPFASICKLVVTVVVSATLLLVCAVALVIFLFGVPVVELTRRKWSDTFVHE